MDDIHKNIEEYNPNKKRKILILIDYMISDVLSNEKRTPSRFRKNLSERIWKLVMTIDDKIRDEKPQHNMNRETAKVSALS